MTTGFVPVPLRSLEANVTTLPDNRTVYYNAALAMSKQRRQAKQPSMWVATHDLPRGAPHPFYARTHPHDPDAKITKMKDGRTHLANKAELPCTSRAARSSA